jgi:hypothetical protein
MQPDDHVREPHTHVDRRVPGSGQRIGNPAGLAQQVDEGLGLNGEQPVSFGMRIRVLSGGSGVR